MLGDVMADLDARRSKLKDDFIAARGYWSELWYGVLELSPDFFEAYSAFSSVPWKHGTLPPKIKELIHDGSLQSGHPNPHRQRAQIGRDARRGDGSARDRLGAGHSYHFHGIADPDR
jgi:hypothetical protein